MLTRIQALNYRCLKRVDLALGPFQVLVGPNGSGKSTLLDVPIFFRDLLGSSRDGILTATSRRSANFQDLLFGREGGYFELAVEARIPKALSGMESVEGEFDTVRYQLQVGIEPETRRVAILQEDVFLKKCDDGAPTTRSEEMKAPEESETILEDPDATTSFRIVEKLHDGYDFFSPERPQPKSKKVRYPLEHRFRLGAEKSAFANLPEDDTQFPVAVWFRRQLMDGTQLLDLHYESLRKPNPPGFGSSSQLGDGSNLAWQIEKLRSGNSAAFADWLAHIRVAFPELMDVKTVERLEDRHRYLVLENNAGMGVPSWMVSEGTLRLLALTLTAYLLDDGRLLLVEEPENCIHPLAIEIVMQSLNSMYESQVLVTTHSPAILSLTAPDKILCFSKTPEEGTLIVRGDKHPRLSAWKGSVDPGMLLASGILG